MEKSLEKQTGLFQMPWSSAVGVCAYSSIDLPIAVLAQDVSSVWSPRLLRQINDTVSQCPRVGTGWDLKQNFKYSLLSGQPFPVPLTLCHTPHTPTHPWRFCDLWMPWDQAFLAVPTATILNTQTYTWGSLSVTEIILEGIICFCLTLTSVAQPLSGNRLLLKFELDSNLSPNATTGQELGIWGRGWGG